MSIVVVKNVAGLPLFPPSSLLAFDLETYGFRNRRDLDFCPFGVQPMLEPSWFDTDTGLPGYRPALDVLANQVRICAVREQGGEHTYVIDVARVGYEAMVAMLSGHPLLGHNLAFDLTILFRLGLPDPPYVRDTLIAGRVLTAGVMDVHAVTGAMRPKSLALGKILYEMLGVIIDKNLGGGAKSDWGNLELSEDQITYAGTDVEYLMALYTNLEERLAIFGLEITNKLEQDLIVAITRMALAGMAVDVKQWTQRTQDTNVRQNVLRGTLRTLLPPVPRLGERKVRLTKTGSPYRSDVAYNAKIKEENAIAEWNVSSWQQVRDVMQLVGVPLPLKQDTTIRQFLKESTPESRHVRKHVKPVPPPDDCDVFERESKLDNEYVLPRGSPRDEDSECVIGEVRVKTDRVTLTLLKHLHPSIPVILKLREAKKEFTSFGDKWLYLHCRGGRVYADWHQLGTLTGRMSVSSPNLQQVARGLVRRGIIAPEGKVLVRADYSQIEVRIAAKISMDPVLLEVFQSGRDVHTETAKRVLGKSQITDGERQTGKSLNFGLLYSMSAKSLRVYCSVNYGVDFTPEQAEMFRNLFFSVYTGLAAWHKRTKLDSYAADETRTLIGRRRWIKQELDNRMGLCLNSPVQGTGADMLKIAVAEWYPGWGMGEKLVAMVHDELIFEVNVGEAAMFADKLKSHMIRVGADILDPVPCDVTIKISDTWG